MTYNFTIYDHKSENKENEGLKIEKQWAKLCLSDRLGPLGLRPHLYFESFSVLLKW